MEVNIPNIKPLTTWLCAGASNAVVSQKLACVYSEVQQKNLPKVWCKQNSSDCCTGVILNNSTQLLDGRKLSVIQNKDSFTVIPLKLSHGGGIYWCGVLSKNNEFIKLAEGYFYSCKMIYQHPRNQMS